MTTQLRQGIVDGKPEIQLAGEVERDEVYVSAGHKGNPEAVKKKGALDGATTRQKAVESSSRFIAFSKGFGVAAPSKKRSRPFSG